MTEKRIETLYGSAGFDYDSASTVVRSVAAALADLQNAAASTNGEVVWSTVALSFQVDSISEQRITAVHPTLRTGRRFVTAQASVILQT